MSLWTRRQERVPGRRAARRRACIRRVPLVPRRLDRARARGDAVLRADGELLQALPGRLVGADAHRLELRQPHRRLPRRRRGPALRIECRIPGADCNPYLAFAASLASGLDGIANKIEPPPMFEGDVYAAQNLPRVPDDARATRPTRFDAERVRAKAFGADVVEHYAHFFRTEQASLRQGRHRLGAAALLREDLTTVVTTRRQGRADHRAPAAASAASRRCSSPPRARASSSSTSTRRTARRPSHASRPRAARPRTSAPTSRRPPTARRWSRFAEKTFGKLDVLFNNAGIMHSRTTTRSRRPRRSGT